LGIGTPPWLASSLPAWPSCWPLTGQQPRSALATSRYGTADRWPLSDMERTNITGPLVTLAAFPRGEAGALVAGVAALSRACRRTCS
jgi:hypothetical protein